MEKKKAAEEAEAEEMELTTVVLLPTQLLRVLCSVCCVTFRIAAAHGVLGAEAPEGARPTSALALALASFLLLLLLLLLLLQPRVLLIVAIGTVARRMTATTMRRETTIVRRSFDFAHWATTRAAQTAAAISPATLVASCLGCATRTTYELNG